MCLLLLLTSCATALPVAPLCPAVPAVLLNPVQAPELGTDPSWRDVALYAASMRSALHQCNVDKEQIRDWSARSAEQ
uniref:Rz1-like lysis system protein LysC n=1 Tax=Marinobacterium profundum TaxID=1714300 RepID=UPI003F6F2511